MSRALLRPIAPITRVRGLQQRKFKLFAGAADVESMITPISSTHTSNPEQSSQPSSKPSASTQKPKSNSAPQDKVTIRSGGDADHDGDRK